jgi:hypothetical protein
MQIKAQAASLPGFIAQMRRSSARLLAGEPTEQYIRQMDDAQVGRGDL